MSKCTIKDVAKDAGVSIATVSRVLNQSHYVGEELQNKVQESVKKLNYQPNAVARSLKMKKTNMIEVMKPDLSNPYFIKISRKIEEFIIQKGYQLIFCSSGENPEKEKELLSLLYEKRVEAIVLASSGVNEELIKEFNEFGMPIILVD